MKKKNWLLSLCLIGVISCASVALAGCNFSGADGKSAYQIWLDNGHTGSEADFLDWLKGTYL